MVRTFRGEERFKVDAKGRVSIPAAFRRVLEAGDPSWEPDKNPQLVLVYGDERRNFLECFTIEAMQDVEKRIKKLPRADVRRRRMQRLYNTQALHLAVDDGGRLVLPQKLREKIGLEGWAYFAATGDTFEIWKPETYEAMADEEFQPTDDFDPDADPSIYLFGDEEE